MKGLLIILLSGAALVRCDDTVTRYMYDTMSQLVGDQMYPDTWWTERQQCFDKISPGLIDTLDLAWQVWSYVNVFLI